MTRMAGRARFVLATFNPDKRRELAALLALTWLELVALSDIPGAVAPEETGATLHDNARLKATAASRLSGLPAIADDTGLEVDALNGAPGVRTARFAGPDASYADNVRALLAALEHVPDAQRGARFRTVCVAHFPGAGEVVVEGAITGRITRAPRGTNGFGYDPIFELSDGRTLAELSDAEKAATSHRARAVRALATRLAAEPGVARSPFGPTPDAAAP